jgi:hypothetical protein
MVAFNDNVVFTDTSNDATTWQRVRLLTLLDLPRPEVLMNVWSYQASSPDGKEIMKSAERVRGLVAAHNDALEDSIQYGWSYLSREMKNDARLPEIATARSNYPSAATITIEGYGFGPSEPSVSLEPISAVSNDPELKVRTYYPVLGQELQPPPIRIRDCMEAELPRDIKPGWYVLAVTNKDTLLTGRRNVKIGSGDFPPPPPPPEPGFFDRDFYDYVTQKFVADPPGCTGDPEEMDLELRNKGPRGHNPTGQEQMGSKGKQCLKAELRERWGFCPAGKYCLGFTQAFQPLKPNLTSILLGAISSQHPLKTILTTIACMEGKWEVYPDECFPYRDLVSTQIHTGTVGPVVGTNRKIRNTVTASIDGSAVDTDSAANSPALPALHVCKTLSDDRVRMLIPGQRNVKYEVRVSLVESASGPDTEAKSDKCAQKREMGVETTSAKDTRKVSNRLTVTVTETVPPELTLRLMSGKGWNCKKLPKCTTQVGENEPINPIAVTVDVISPQATCLHDRRAALLKEARSNHSSNDRLSCGLLDDVALRAQEECGIAQSFPMSCFTIQAAQSFSSQDSFSTFPLEELNELAEQPIANSALITKADQVSGESGTTRIGLLRAAVADFLFNYKMSQEFPQDFVPYDLQHSAQELNAELNPMVVAFNEDVAAFSHHLSDHLESDDPNRNHSFQLWRNRKSFLSDGIITVRGIGGIYSTVDTVTQNFFDATQAESLSAILSTLTGQGGTASGSTSSPGAALTALQGGALNATTGIAALAALVPPTTEARIGRDLSFYVTPYTLPGASSAELQVQLTAAEDAPPNLYQAGNATGSIDPLSRVSKHNVSTRIRVESIKLFELSSFSALIQRPRSKFPLIPPLIELPFIGSLASLPLPGAKEYHRSTAIVSAVIVPTAADLAYGIDFAHDRLITKERPTAWGHNYEMRSVSSLTQFQTQSERMPIRAFHKAMVNCLATNGGLTAPGGLRSEYPERCTGLDFRRVPPEF